MKRIFTRCTTFRNLFNVCDPSRFIFHTDFVGLIRRRCVLDGKIKPCYSSHWISCRKLGVRCDINEFLSMWSMMSGDFYPFFDPVCRHESTKVGLCTQCYFFNNPTCTLAIYFLCANTATYTYCYKHHSIWCIHVYCIYIHRCPGWIYCVV